MIDRLVDKKNAPTPNLVFGGPSITLSTNKKQPTMIFFCKYFYLAESLWHQPCFLKIERKMKVVTSSAVKNINKAMQCFANQNKGLLAC